MYAAPAYLAAHEPAKAATEFQNILDHRGIVLGDPWCAMAHLQLGRALALSGDTVKAKTAYQDLLTSGTPPTRISRFSSKPGAEYARLQ